MRILFVLAGLACLVATGTASAQDLVVTNARILDGTGRAIDRGSVVVRGGRIASVSPGTPPSSPGARVIDARGRTVMPGLVDAHRHPIPAANTAEWMAKQAPAEMRGFLEAGFTTVLSAITSVDGLELRRRIEAGAITGPRIFAGAIIPLAGAAAGAGRGSGGRSGTPGPAAAPAAGRGDPARFDNSRPPLRPTSAAPAIPADDTIKAVDAAAKAGFDYIKTVITATPGGPETDTLRLIVTEGRKRNIPTITHAVSVIDTLAAVEAGPAVLVHTPHIGRLEEDQAAVQRIAKAGIPMTSTLAVFLPHFAAGSTTPLFRDGMPFPWNTLSSAGQGPVNARLLWDAGVSLGYGTDTSWPPKESLRDELRALTTVFAPGDIVTILTRNAARSVLKADQIGTLEPGKAADLVIIDGNPLTDIYDVLKVVTTVKDGRVVWESSQAVAR